MQFCWRFFLAGKRKRVRLPWHRFYLLVFFFNQFEQFIFALDRKSTIPYRNDDIISVYFFVHSEKKTNGSAFAQHFENFFAIFGGHLSDRSAKFPSRLSIHSRKWTSTLIDKMKQRRLLNKLFACKL